MHEHLRAAQAIAARVREIVQGVWDKKHDSDKQAWMDLHGQAMHLLEWDTAVSALAPTLTDQVELLRELRSFLDNQSDVDASGTRPNTAMRLLMELDRLFPEAK